MKSFSQLLDDISVARREKFGTSESLTRARVILKVDVNLDELTAQEEKDPVLINRLIRAASELGISMDSQGVIN